MKKLIKNLFIFTKKNYFLVIFIAAVFLVISYIVYKTISSKPTYLYVKVKMNQGYWWASSTKPSLWFVDSLKKELAQKKFQKKSLKKSDTELISITDYPWYGSSQYDVFLVLKLRVSVLKNGEGYVYKRSTIGVGAPIDIELPHNQLSGTITNMSERPFVNNYVEKTVYLTKYYAFRWEYDTIKVGSVFNNGEQNIIKIIDKQILDTTQQFINPVGDEKRDHLVIKTKMLLRVIDDKYVFGEEQLIAPGQTISLATKDFIFAEFVVLKVE